MEGTYSRNRISWKDVSTAKLGGGKSRIRHEIPRKMFVTQMYPPYKKLHYPSAGFYSLAAYHT